MISTIEKDTDNDYHFKYEFKFLENPITNETEYWFEVGKVLDYHDKDSEFFKEKYFPVIQQHIHDHDKLITSKFIFEIIILAIFDFCIFI